MSRRGQGAMEYFMTYGWALIVVITVGVVLWQTGFLEMGKSMPVTTTGFVQVKPITANCLMHEFGLDDGYYNGFGCQFQNNVGKPINIVGLDIKVNGEYCAFQDLGDNVFQGTGRWTDKSCFTSQDCGNVLWVPPEWVVPKSGMFTIGTDGNIGTPFANICDNINPNEFYLLDVKIAYQVELGETQTIKYSNGEIRINSE